MPQPTSYNGPYPWRCVVFLQGFGAEQRLTAFEVVVLDHFFATAVATEEAHLQTDNQQVTKSTMTTPAVGCWVVLPQPVPTLPCDRKHDTTSM